LILLFGQPLTRFRLALLPVLRVRVELDLFRIVDLLFTARLGPKAATPLARLPSLLRSVRRTTATTTSCRAWKTTAGGVCRTSGWSIRFSSAATNTPDAGLLQHLSFRLPEFDFAITCQELFEDV
jgi:hypothetical protein